MFSHVAILLNFMQWIEEYLLALNYFDYSCSLGYNQKVKTSRLPVLKLHDLIFFFPFTFENGHRFETFFALIMLGIDTL